MANVAGIDWASEEHAVCVVDEAGTPLRERVVAHDEAGIAAMKSLLVAMESDVRGYAEFPLAYFEQIDDAYEQFQSLPGDFLDAGAAVLVTTDVQWRGRRSGAYGQTPLLAAFWLRDGKVYREETFTDRAQALQAVGLSE